MRRYRLVMVALATLGLAGWLARQGWQGEVEAPAPPPVAVATSVPSATPPPWLASSLALAVPDGDGFTVAVVSPDEEAPARALAGPFEAIGQLAWAPDGSTLAFAARRQGNWDLFTVGREGSGLARHTQAAAFDGDPAWAPDGAALAFASYRDGEWAVYRMPLTRPVAPVSAASESAPREVPEAGLERLTEAGHEAREPAFAPDGTWLAYSAWRDGAWQLEARPTAGGSGQVLVSGEPGADRRAPAWAADGRRLRYVTRRWGAGQLADLAWGPDGPAAAGTAAGLADRVVRAAGRVAAFATYPGGAALATVTDSRGARQVAIADSENGRRASVVLPPGAGAALAWSALPPDPGLPPLAVTERPEPASADPAAQPGLVDLAGVQVSGARINGALAADYDALRAEVRAATGQDFLGRLSDAWRPLGFFSSASAFFSWHKTGRAFDTQMELRGAGGRRDMVLVREDAGYGGPLWRMYLRAAAQDGSVGAPLGEPGWTFGIGSDDAELVRQGGQRGTILPGGYWVDFTALAERYGWRRIPSLARPGLDWHRDWEALEYWHYERRDGLRWFEAARQVYEDPALIAELHPERLRERQIPVRSLARLGFPPGWPPEG